jgi:hypothetical protein
MRYYLLMQTTAPDVATEPIPSECSLSTEHHSRFCPTCSSRLENKPLQAGLPDLRLFPELRGFLLVTWIA